MLLPGQSAILVHLCNPWLLHPGAPSTVGTNLLLVMQALVIVLECRRALLLARIVLSRSVDNIACHDILPEGKAAADT